jgi:leucyl-tRNA synthetase
MHTYDFKSLEAKWQKEWLDNQIYKTDIDPDKPKFYALDMFPYPSGAGLHVGHPLGYIASDIVSRYKRLNGFNVLHPMGFDAFGLPAEQYAIQTGQHPAITTAENLARYKEQLNRIGFSFDWSREVQTCDPNYYKWTQWIFIQLFESWYNQKSDKAESIDQLISIFEHEGNVTVEHKGDETIKFTAEEWENFSELERSDILQAYRLAFQKETTVNWCEELGTVLANDEVKDGFSERGGHPVTQKLMKQWYLRITAYSDRLLDGLNRIDWSDSIKEMQRNWIGRSEGARIDFRVEILDDRPNTEVSYLKSNISDLVIQVFTTRPDTIFGSTFMVLAPDHELVSIITTKEQRAEVEAYATKANNKSERERMMNKEVSGVFTGGYALHPFTQKKLPIYISEYVLSGYGTGAIMAVPAHDERDHAFAKKFGLEIVQVVRADTNQNDTNQDDFDIQEKSYDAKEGRLMNSENFDRLTVKEGMQAIIQLAEERGFGEKKVNYKLRDAGYSRQRYWGEPFPIIYNDGVPTVDTDLPVTLPEVKSYKPTGTGESPLASNTEWVNTTTGRRETDTMPGYAGSSWYFLRYMDPNNTEAFASKESLEYWNQVDLYIGGTEHATGHLLYSRFWTKFLYDLGYLNFDEPFKKLVNQGMIQGESMMLNVGERELHVPIEMATKDATISIEKLEELKNKDNRFESIDLNSLNAENGIIQLRTQVEKMSKSKYNVVNPDDVCEEYGADTLRLYEMFLGPLEDSKPWSTKGIDGTYRFLKKLWALFYNQDGEQLWNESEPSKDSLKTLHKTIKKITDDIDNFSFNTSVAQFMICVNELGSQKCNSKSVLEKVLVLLAPFAPHITEELWNKIGNNGFIADASWPVFDEKHLVESSKVYPISINGKTRTNLEFPLDMSKEEIEKNVLADEIVQKWLDGKPPKKVIVVPGRIVNVVM